MSIYLQYPDMSVNDLFEAWIDLENLREKALDFIRDQKAEQVEDGKADSKAAFAYSMDFLDWNFCVLDAWAALMHAAYVFAIHGRETFFFAGTSMSASADTGQYHREA